MRDDATVNVTCDKCGHNEIWEPDYVYSDYSGEGGHYDTSDSAFAEWCASAGWTQEGEKDFCDGCALSDTEGE